MLTLDQLRRYSLPKNASRANNLSAAIHQLAVYNDSVNLYQAIKLVIDEEVTSAADTDLSNTPAATTLTIESSTGTDTILPAATTSLAGVMTSTDKTRLNNLITLSGVAAAATTLGSFTGSIILDNRTIKQALQDLETSLESGTGLSLGNLTSTSNDLTIVGGTSSVFNPTGVSITFNPGNLTLSEIGGTLDLTQLTQSGATSGQVLIWNGVSWVPSSTPTITHNSLSSLQGGQASQYYHLNSSLYNVLSNSSSSRLVGRYSAGSGAVQSLALPNSVTITAGGIVQLTNDVTTPGNSYYYGTNGVGTKGWYTLPTASGTLTTATDSADLNFTIVGDDLTAELTPTGVSASSYGSATDTVIIDVDDKGRVTNLLEVPISIPNTQISNWTSAIETGDYTISGDWVFSNTITASTSPTLNSHLVNKGYVDTLLATGVNTIKVEVATTVAGTLATDFENGDTVDTIVLVTGDYILIKDQASLPTNGIYEVQASGAPIRVPEMDVATEVDGTVAIVKNGATNAGSLWITASNVVTIDVDPIEFTQINTPFSPSLGTSNQLFGMDNAGAASEWKTLTGTANQVTVTHGVGTITLATPQNIHTAATPTFGILTLAGSGGFGQLNMTGASGNDIYMQGNSSSIIMESGSPIINLVEKTNGGVASGPQIKFELDDAAATASGDRLGYLTFLGRGAVTTDITGAFIKVVSTELFTNTSSPAEIQFATTPTGTTSPIVNIIIASTGETQFRNGTGIRLYDSDNTQYVAIIPPATGSLTANYTLTLPTTDGAASEVLTTDGAGTLSWSTVAGVVDTLYSADGTIGSTRTAILTDSLEFDGSGVTDGDYFYVNLNPGTGQTELLLTAGIGGSSILRFDSNGITADATSTTLTASDDLILFGNDIELNASTSLAINLATNASGDTYYRNGSGKFTRLAIGSAGQVLTVSAGAPSWATPATGGSPAGTNYNLQYYNSGAFGADANITVTPGAQMKLAVGTSTPAATLHAKNHNDAGSTTILAENSSGNDIVKVLSSGYTQWGDNESLPRIYQTTTVGSAPAYTGGGLTIEGLFTVGASYEILGLTHTQVDDGSDGPFSVLKLTGTHAPTSGAGDYVSIKVAPIINQTGTHTGDGYGIQVAPTLTAIGDNYIAYFAAVNNADAFGFVQEGTLSLNYFEGNTGFGTTLPTAPLEVEGIAKVGHLVGNSGIPSYTLGASSIVGSGASLTLVGHDTGFEATLITGTGVSSIGTIFTVTFNTPFVTNAPVVVFAERDLMAAIYAASTPPYVNSTSTTNFTFNNTAALSSSTTYKWSFITVGK